MYEICIIGGGLSGLTTCKTFSEITDNIIVLDKCENCMGSFSNIKEKDYFKWSSSKYISGFSDFPMGEEIPVWFTIKEYIISTRLNCYKFFFPQK